jgi:hypothetical protein
MQFNLQKVGINDLSLKWILGSVTWVNKGLRDLSIECLNIDHLGIFSAYPIHYCSDYYINDILTCLRAITLFINLWNSSRLVPICMYTKIMPKQHYTHREWLHITHRLLYWTSYLLIIYGLLKKWIAQTTKTVAINRLNLMYILGNSIVLFWVRHSHPSRKLIMSQNSLYTWGW